MRFVVEIITRKQSNTPSAKKCKQLFCALREFFNSYLFYGIETLVACLFVLMGEEVFGAIVFVALLGVILIVCDDILPTTLPFLLLCTFSTNCYNSYDTFMSYAIYAPIVILALIAHFVVYHKPFRLGQSVYGICGVSIALLLGGIGNFSLMEYAYGSYYILGLGIGMIVCYILMKSQFSPRRDYNLRERFSVIMMMMGLLCVAMIAIAYIRRITGNYNAHGVLGFSRNNICTLLMFAMPFPLYLTKKTDWWALVTLLLFGAICVSTSRGGLLFGSVEFIVCCIYWVYIAKKKLYRILCVSLSIAALGLCCGSVILDIINDRILADNAIVNESRYVMIWQAVERFLKNPLVGSGLLDNTIDYGGYRKPGTMAWYHMMIPQVFGSMGLVGVAAYGLQALGRFKLIFMKTSSWSLALGISYLGILMMSQVNPGEFCPLPFELLTVLLFVLQERRIEGDILPIKKNNIFERRINKSKGKILK